MKRYWLPLLGACIGGVYGAAVAFPSLAACVLGNGIFGLPNHYQCSSEWLGIILFPAFLSFACLLVLRRMFLPAGEVGGILGWGIYVVFWAVIGGSMGALLQKMGRSTALFRVIDKVGFGKDAIVEMKRKERKGG